MNRDQEKRKQGNEINKSKQKGRMSRLINNFTDKYTSRRYELIERQGDGGEVEKADINMNICIYVYIYI
jgi:hypothetical protein